MKIISDGTACQASWITVEPGICNPGTGLERVYAGVLGKIIGVYLGRPVEGMTYEAIAAELGEISYYAHEPRGQPLVVSDDDISGTFTFLQALPDHGYALDLTAPTRSAGRSLSMAGRWFPRRSTRRISRSAWSANMPLKMTRRP